MTPRQSPSDSEPVFLSEKWIRTRYLRDPTRKVKHHTMAALPFVAAFFASAHESVQSYEFTSGMNFPNSSYTATAKINSCFPRKMGISFHEHIQYQCSAILNLSEPDNNPENAASFSQEYWHVHTLRNVAGQTLTVKNSENSPLARENRDETFLILSDHPRPDPSLQAIWPYAFWAAVACEAAIGVWMLFALCGYYNRTPRKSAESAKGSDSTTRPASSLY